MTILSSSEKPKAVIRGGMLVLSLPNAVSPVVWRLDMRSVTSSALEIREDKDLFDLVLKTQKADIQKIASFDDKKKAIKALGTVTKAIEEAPLIHFQADNALQPSNTQPVANEQQSISEASSTSKGATARPILAGIIGAFVIVMLLIMLGIFRSGPGLYTNAPGAPTANSSAKTTGAPVSADDFLRARN